MDLDYVPFEMVALDVQVFDRGRRLELKPSTGGEEKGDHPSQKNDWDKEQTKGPRSEAFYRRL